eukprot:jgi/Bigna1/133878/aug1.23_g8586
MKEYGVFLKDCSSAAKLQVNLQKKARRMQLEHIMLRHKSQEDNAEATSQSNLNIRKDSNSIRRGSNSSWSPRSRNHRHSPKNEGKTVRAHTKSVALADNTEFVDYSLPGAWDKQRAEKEEAIVYNTQDRLPLFPSGNLAEKTLQLVESMSSSQMSIVVQGIIHLLILISALTIAIESLEKFRYPKYGNDENDKPPVFNLIETTAVVIFTIELSIRAAVVPFVSVKTMQKCGYTVECERNSTAEGNIGPFRKFRIWFCSGTTMIDIFSTMPYYAELVMKGMKGLVVISRAMERSMWPLLELGRQWNEVHYDSMPELLPTDIGTVIEAKPTNTITIFKGVGEDIS